ncbi:peptide ABC transporter permease [Fredinandcohnia humi]
MKRLPNLKLSIGSILLFFFIFIAIFGPRFAPYDVDFSNPVKWVQTDEGEQLRGSPFPPSKENLFGTDKWGFDILTLMLHGARYTVFAAIGIALVRVIIGASLGMYRGLQSKEVKKKPKVTVLSGIPPFLLVFFVMVGISIQSSLDTMTLIYLQSVLMIIVGIPGVHESMCARTIEIVKLPFVVASQTVGGSRLHILKEHILPMMTGSIVLTFVNEVILVLNLIGQLAIFDLFFGGTELQISPTIYLSITNEWAGLIAHSRMNFYFTKWVVLFPLMGYLLYLFSFYLLLIGIKEMQRGKYRSQAYL